MPLPHKFIVNSLLSAAAGSLLATQSASAAVITFDESSSPVSGDFSNTFSGRNALSFSSFQRVTGNMDASTDPDVFQFTNLTAGTTFSLAISYSNTQSASSSFTIRDDSETNIGSSVFTPTVGFGANSNGTITGTVPLSGNLNVDIQQNSAEASGSSYDVTLTAVPEPATATVTLLGAAAAALALRSRKKAN